ncbi:Eco57I restriction-modification methylase domain-containing protein [Ruminococcus champanellensis]|nr:Eco57I restriction-modification methylase domain-containing protein [Ruminococcus champanellensis]
MRVEHLSSGIKKMLSDSHFKILMYEGDASTIFPNTDIKGGVVISYRNTMDEFGAIQTFTIYPQLNTILKRILQFVENNSLAELAFVATKFNSENLFRDFSHYEGHERRMSSNVLSFDCFHSEKQNRGDIQIYGIYEKKRSFRYISYEYVDLSDTNIQKYKIIMPKADGNGAFGSIITMPEILPPASGFTHTFLGLGGFETKDEAKAALKYIKTKFARALLGVLKVTQDLNADKWKYVPLQDFTPTSDIDWSKPIAEIDRQLYKKYGLTPDEIKFIETHVKEMK